MSHNTVEKYLFSLYNFLMNTFTYYPEISRKMNYKILCERFKI